VSKTKKKTIEELITRLEEISEKIGEGSIGLEESIELYEEGQNIAKECAERLSAAQKKLEVINPASISTNDEEDVPEE